MSTPEQYEVFAIRYGHMAERTRGDNFISTDDHDSPMPIDYSVWVIRNANRTLVVDTGFDHNEAGLRGRKLERLPREGLAMIGVDAGKVEDVIVTHLHYDHAGTLDDFPAATFHLQESEMNYATGRHMCSAHLSAPYTANHVCDMVRAVFDRRVCFHDGSREIAPGIEVHHIGGHSMGVQVVRVLTARGWVVLASDASHYYENFETGSPFIIAYSVAEMIDGFNRLYDLADSPQHIVPGHDPLVSSRYPAYSEQTGNIIVRLDQTPSD